MNLPRITALSVAVASAAAHGADIAATAGRRTPFAPDAVYAQAGRASATTSITAGLQWKWDRTWRLGDRALVAAYSDLSIGHWRADRGGSHATLTQFGFTPTLRCWVEGIPSGWFVEGAVGVNALTPVYRTRDKRFSTAFNFGDHVALGYRTHDRRRWEWLLRLQHFSNAGIERPNPGENFVQLRLVVPLENFGI